jgi:hypothetical protein
MAVIKKSISCQKGGYNNGTNQFLYFKSINKIKVYDQWGMRLIASFNVILKS